MSARTERARARFIKASRETAAHLHSFTVRAHDAKHMKALYLADKTKANRMAYRLAKKLRARRLRTYRRSRARRNALKVIYLASKALDRDPRARAIKWAKAQVGTTEATGNNDGPKILRWQRATARGETYLDRAPYCGIGVENACRHAGVKTTPRWASVAAIEDDARAGKGGFRGYTTDPSRVKVGDLVILFGRGIHVEIVIRIDSEGVHTIGFNTSPGTSGSQSNGGGVYYRIRPLSAVHGFPLVDYSK